MCELLLKLPYSTYISAKPIKQWGFGEEVSIFDILSLLFVKKIKRNLLIFYVSLSSVDAW